MTWKNLSEDVVAEFAHYEHGIAYLTNDGGRELAYVAYNFPDDICSPGQTWIEGDDCERAAVVAALTAINKAKPAPPPVRPKRVKQTEQERKAQHAYAERKRYSLKIEKVRERVKAAQKRKYNEDPEYRKRVCEAQRARDAKKRASRT